MTEPRAADDPRAGEEVSGPAETGPDPGPTEAEEVRGQQAEPIVIRDRRRVSATGTRGKPAKKTDRRARPEPPVAEESARTEAPAEPSAPAAPEPSIEEAGAPGLGAELEALRTELEERTRDLQRVSAEYANYRKRVDRDRGLVAEQATGQVLGALLPVLDDLDRAREHGDLVGPFGAVAEQLVATAAKFGLSAFGEKGDPFDPTRHEAVAHQTSSEVSEPTCVDVMRRGYLLGDKLLRPALVAVADPE